MPNKILTKTNLTDKVFTGVCGGLARYLGIGSIWIRLVFALVFFYYGSGLLLYVILALVLPDEYENNNY